VCVFVSLTLHSFSYFLVLWFRIVVSFIIFSDKNL
jgi:hypothetical protein